MNKSKAESLSRSQILQWINRTLNITETKIQNLGSGVVYCMLIHHFFPSSLPNNKIIMIPRSPVDYRNNLKRLQDALATVDLKIAFDVFKVAEMTYAENWVLINKLHKALTSPQRSTHQFETKQQQRWQPSKNQSQQSQFSSMINAPHTNTLSTPISLTASMIGSHHINHVPVISNGLMTSIIHNNMMSISGSHQSISNPMATPMKNFRVEDGGKSRWQTVNTIQEIKRIVSKEQGSDRVKVSQLKKLLGLQEDEGADSEGELKDLLSDYKKKQEVIYID